MAESLREHERANPSLDTRQERLATAGSAALFAAWVGAGVALSMVTLPILGSVAALISGGALVRNLRQPIRDAIHRHGQRKPAATRRRLALPPAEGLVGRVRGVPAAESVVRAPISDRPCLAWRVRARLRDEDGERLVIDDTRSVAFELEGRRFEADGAGIEAPTSHARLSELEPDARERATRFLRERGCFSHEGDWSFEEERVELGRPVELEGRGRQAAPVLRHDDEAATSPYR